MTDKHIVCYSGGHSSALVAIEVFRKYGNGDMVLVNHDINPSVEDADVKRFKKEVAEYIGVPITFVNMKGWDTKDQFDVVMEAQAFKVGNGTALCSSRLKTEPFHKWLTLEFPSQNCVLYYGFDENEKIRIQRRQQILGQQGWRVAFPLAHWSRTIRSTEEVGIRPPLTYGQFKHANCVGCLKAGKQHWYVVYCTRPDLWAKAKQAEDTIGYTLFREESLEELEPRFAEMKRLGIPADENIPSGRFWKMVRDAQKAAASMCTLSLSLSLSPDQ